MSEMDDFLKRISEEMHQREIRDIEEELDWRMRVFEATTRKLQTMIVLEGFFLPYLREEGNAFETQDARESFEPAQTKEEDVQSYRVLSVDMQVAAASAFSHIEGLGKVEDAHNPAEVIRQNDESLPPNQVYVLMRRSFDPASPTIRGLLETPPAEQNSGVQRVLRIDLLPPFYDTLAASPRR